jgi:hypothetical protein
MRANIETSHEGELDFATPQSGYRLFDGEKGRRAVAAASFDPGRRHAQPIRHQLGRKEWPVQYRWTHGPHAYWSGATTAK